MAFLNFIIGLTPPPKKNVKKYDPPPKKKDILYSPPPTLKLEGTNHANDKFYINKLINTRFSFLRYILQLIKQTIKIYSVSHSAIIQSEKRKKLQRYS